MKRLLLTILVLVAMTAGVQTMKAQEAYAVYTSGNKTLTFYFDKQRSSRAGEAFAVNNEVGIPEWCREDIYQAVTTVKFDASFAGARPTTTAYWFLAMGALQSIIGLPYLNTSEVINMCQMFSQCTHLTSLDLSSFNTSKVETFEHMFFDCEALLNLNLSSWDTSNAQYMNYMFSDCKALQCLDLSSFNTSKVYSMSSMFDDCLALTSLDLSSFDMSQVKYTSYMFYKCYALTTIYVGDGWDTSNVTSSGYMFYNCNNLVGGAGTTYDSSHIDAAYAHIDGGTSNPGYFTAKGPKLGDANLDGVVDIADVVTVLNAMANDLDAPQFKVNDDNVVDIADVVAVLNIMAQQ